MICQGFCDLHASLIVVPSMVKCYRAFGEQVKRAKSYPNASNLEAGLPLSQ